MTSTNQLYTLSFLSLYSQIEFSFAQLNHDFISAALRGTYFATPALPRPDFAAFTPLQLRCNYFRGIKIWLLCYQSEAALFFCACLLMGCDGIWMRRKEKMF
jgi:hypothetical protein